MRIWFEQKQKPGGQVSSPSTRKEDDPVGPVTSLSEEGPSRYDLEKKVHMANHVIAGVWFATWDFHVCLVGKGGNTDHILIHKKKSPPWKAREL